MAKISNKNKINVIEDDDEALYAEEDFILDDKISPILFFGENDKFIKLIEKKN